MQDRADLGMTRLTRHEGRLGPPAGAVQAHFLHRLNQPSRVTACREPSASLGQLEEVLKNNIDFSVSRPCSEGGFAFQGRRFPARPASVLNCRSVVA